MAGELNVTVRTKAAIRVWAGDPTLRIILDHPIDKFRTEPNPRRQLNVRVNQQFQGEKGFPILPTDWDALSLTTVRNLRDAARNRLENNR